MAFSLSRFREGERPPLSFDAFAGTLGRIRESDVRMTDLCHIETDPSPTDALSPALPRQRRERGWRCGFFCTVIIGVLGLIPGSADAQVFDIHQEESLAVIIALLILAALTALAGLFWLHVGSNSLGSDPQSDVVLPSGAPKHAGTLEFRDGKVSWQKRVLASDAAPHPDELKIGDLVLTIIERGGKTGVRLRDPNAATRRNFTGNHWFPAAPAWRIEAKWIPYAQPKKIPITNILGMTDEEPVPGVAEHVPHRAAGAAVDQDVLAADPDQEAADGDARRQHAEALDAIGKMRRVIQGLIVGARRREKRGQARLQGRGVLAQGGEGEYLETAGVGEEIAFPAGEAVQTPRLAYYFVPRAQVEVVSIGQD